MAILSWLLARLKGQQQRPGNFDYICERNLKSETALKGAVDENQKIIGDILKNCEDVVFRPLTIGSKQALLVYIDNLTDDKAINKFLATRQTLPLPNAQEFPHIEDALINVLTGFAVIIVDGQDKVFVLDTKMAPMRAVSEPSQELSIKGPRDSFTEDLSTNLALVRKRVSDPRLKVRKTSVGARSKTSVAVLYVEDIVNQQIVDNVFLELGRIDVDVVLDSSLVQQFLDNRPYDLFEQARSTERPDVTIASLYEGRVGIIVDGSPNILIVPVTLTDFYQSPDDYTVKSAIATYTRLIRVIASIFALYVPALYVAVTSFHPGIIPSGLALSIAGTREGVPFPAFIEALLMETTLQILREAGVRLPRPIEATIGIVGGLVIGQAAVVAGIVSPVMIVVIALTAISAFTVPSYSLSSAFAVLRILFIVLASIYGLFGIVMGSLLMLILGTSRKSFGVPFFTPFGPTLTTELGDSVFYRAPLNSLKKRPAHLQPENLMRQSESPNDR